MAEKVGPDEAISEHAQVEAGILMLGQNALALAQTLQTRDPNRTPESVIRNYVHGTDFLD